MGVFGTGATTGLSMLFGGNVAQPNNVPRINKHVKNSETDIRKEFGVTNYQLTPKEQEGLRWIKKAKVFAHEKLGFKLMWNYTKFNEGIKLTSIFYHRKDGLFPFSQLDGERVVALSKRFGKDEASEKGGWLIKGI